MITVRVRFFAGHRDIVGQAEQTYEVDDHATVAELWQTLVTTYPRLAGYTGRLLFAVNQTFVEPSAQLHQDDEVAFIPPVSGGTEDANAALPYYC